MVELTDAIRREIGQVRPGGDSPQRHVLTAIKALRRWLSWSRRESRH